VGSDKIPSLYKSVYMLCYDNGIKSTHCPAAALSKATAVSKLNSTLAMLGCTANIEFVHKRYG